MAAPRQYDPGTREREVRMDDECLRDHSVSKYDEWLLQIADGAVISGATEELRQLTGSLLVERNCISSSALPLSNTTAGINSWPVSGE